MRAIGHAPAAAALVLGAMLASDVRGHVVVLLDRQLQARTVDLISIMSGKVTFTAPPGGEDGAGDVKTITLDSVAAIVEPSWWVGELSPPRLDPRDSQNLGLLELTDGRMITGKLDIPLDASSDSAAEPPKDILRWQHGGILDRLEFKLDEVRRVRMPGAPMTVNDEAAAPKRQDTVILINGDRLSGLVERIGAEIWVSDAGAMTKTPTSRVSEIRLVNPPAAPTGTLVWLQGGTIMRVEHVGADPQRGLLLGIEPAEGKSRQVFAPSDKVEALLPDKSRFHPLSTLKIATQHPGPGARGELRAGASDRGDRRTPGRRRYRAARPDDSGLDASHGDRAFRGVAGAAALMPPVG